MRFLEIVSVIAAVGASGCAARARAGVTLMQPPTSQEWPSVDVGQARMLDESVNPMDGVFLEVKEGAIVAHFSPPHGPAESERLDPSSLDIIAEPRPAVAEPAVGDESAPLPTEPLRVIVEGGDQVIALWKEGDAEQGYRVMAQAFNSTDNSPRGAPVPISPAGADIAGPLDAIRLDRHRVVAAFAASTPEGTFAAYAVPITAP